jgi:hypothetical protein
MNACIDRMPFNASAGCSSSGPSLDFRNIYRYMVDPGPETNQFDASQAIDYLVFDTSPDGRCKGNNVIGDEYESAKCANSFCMSLDDKNASINTPFTHPYTFQKGAYDCECNCPGYCEEHPQACHSGYQEPPNRGVSGGWNYCEFEPFGEWVLTGCDKQKGYNPGTLIARLDYAMYIQDDCKCERCVDCGSDIDACDCSDEYHSCGCHSCGGCYNECFNYTRDRTDLITGNVCNFLDNLCDDPCDPESDCESNPFDWRAYADEQVDNYVSATIMSSDPLYEQIKDNLRQCVNNMFPYQP